MDASVVIRTKDEAHSIAATLKKVSEQVFDGGYEIIIVDSESTDSTLDIVSKFNTRLIQIAQKEFTYGRSLNIGASNANGRFIVNLSAHAVPKDNKWLTSLITPFEDSEVAGVYGRQLSDGRVNPFEALQKELFFGQEKITFNMKNKGKFNEEVPYAEDILWQTAVTEARFSIVYAADAAVYHTHRISIGGAYKDSRNCAYALALMKQKRQSVPRIIFDVGILLCLIPNSIFQNLSFMRQNNYIENLKIAPLYVMCGWFGWLAGRIKYRLKK
jgi:rhamnosyltransferase